MLEFMKQFNFTQSGSVNTVLRLFPASDLDLLDSYYLISVDIPCFVYSSELEEDKIDF